MFRAHRLLPKVVDLFVNPALYMALFMLVGVEGVSAIAQERANQAEATRQLISSAAQSIIAPELVGRNIERDIECLKSIKKLREFLTTVEKEYASEIREGHQPYRDVEGTIKFAREKMDQFQNSLVQYASLPSLQADVEHIQRMLKLAVENQAPAYFNEGNDIARRRLSLKSKATVLKELGATTELEKASKIIEAAEKVMLDAQMKLGKQIVESNTLPSDQYQHPDRADLLKLVESTWSKAVPNKRPIRSGLIGDQWSRTEQWEIQNRTLYKVERSQLQGFVLVAHDTKTVACYHVLIRRDHVDNDKTTSWLMDDPSKNPEPRQLILISKLP